MTARWIVVALFGCHAPIPAAAPAAAPASPPPTPGLPIHLAHGVPIVTATVDGFPLELVVDTGANAHVLIEPALLLVGGTSDASDAVAARAHVQVALGDHLLDPMFRIPPVPALMERRAAGLISPLMFAAEGVQLDLIHGRLAFGATPPDHAPSFTGRIVRCDASAFTAPHALVELAVDGETMVVELDTGSSDTILAADSPIGLRLAARGQPRRLSTIVGTITVSQVDARPVRVGTHQREVPVRFLGGGATPPCAEAHGVVGMDLLSGCILSFAGATFSAHCQAAPGSLPAFAPPPDRIRIRRVELPPLCGVDRATLDRTSEPASPWLFADWFDVARAVTASAAEAGLDDLATASLLVAGSCRQIGTTEPALDLSWTREASELVLHYTPPD